MLGLQKPVSKRKCAVPIRFTVLNKFHAFRIQNMPYTKLYLQTGVQPHSDLRCEGYAFNRSPKNADRIFFACDVMFEASKLIVIRMVENSCVFGIAALANRAPTDFGTQSWAPLCVMAFVIGDQSRRLLQAIGGDNSQIRTPTNS